MIEDESDRRAEDARAKWEGELEDAAENISRILYDIDKIGETCLNEGGREKEAIVEKLKKEYERATEDLHIFREPYLEEVAVATATIENLKDTMSELMGEEKTLSFPRIKIRKKVTKSLKVDNKSEMITFLVKINGIEKGVSKFDLKYLRTLKEADIIPDDVAHFDEKATIYVDRIEEESENEE